MKKPKDKGITEYSLTIEGTRDNWNVPVQFDWTDGFLGITAGAGKDRVLLSPLQIKELRGFIERQQQ